MSEFLLTFLDVTVSLLLSVLSIFLIFGAGVVIFNAFGPIGAGLYGLFVFAALLSAVIVSLDNE
jgi:hypothetical protein